MKWSFAGVGLITFGLIGLVLLMLFETATTTNENDYYLLKEITEASMYDSIDVAYYRSTGRLKIVQEKFVENFVRRYSESTVVNLGDYTISFYDIMEEPPKVSIIITKGIGEYAIYDPDEPIEFDVQNVLNAILEYRN